MLQKCLARCVQICATVSIVYVYFSMSLFECWSVFSVGISFFKTSLNFYRCNEKENLPNRFRRRKNRKIIFQNTKKISMITIHNILQDYWYFHFQDFWLVNCIPRPANLLQSKASPQQVRTNIILKFVRLPSLLVHLAKGFSFDFTLS